MKRYSPVVDWSTKAPMVTLIESPEGEVVKYTDFADMQLRLQLVCPHSYGRTNLCDGRGEVCSNCGWDYKTCLHQFSRTERYAYCHDCGEKL